MKAFYFILLLSVLNSTSVLAQEDADEAALSLADQLPTKTETARDWHIFAEGAFGQSTPRNEGARLNFQRLSLDVQLDKSIAKNWRFIFADQLDLRWQGRLSDNDTVNTLKETYLSWQPQPEWAIDLGRINVRNGVALGYNPTDFFRTGANRSIISVDPSSLKKNRQGSAMLRAQTLWKDGSLTALYSPKLDEHPNTSAFSLDLGATNNENRWLISVSQRISDNFNPQWLLYGEEGELPQIGFNSTTLLNEATVAYVEWSGGRSPSQLSRALNTADDTAFRSRLAAGLTYTTKNKISLTGEYQFNGAGLDQADRDGLIRRPAAYGQYRRWVQNSLDLPTRHAVFLYVNWQDAMRNHLEVNAMLRLNADDDSRLLWLEASYHFDRADLALQWQRNSGSPGSEFGALQQRQTVQALVRYFF